MFYNNKWLWILHAGGVSYQNMASNVGHVIIVLNTHNPLNIDCIFNLRPLHTYNNEFYKWICKWANI